MMPGVTELALILVIVLILFGAGKLPQVFEAFGQGIKKFREAQEEDADERDVTPKPAPKEIPSAPVMDAEEVAAKKQAASGE